MSEKERIKKLEEQVKTLVSQIEDLNSPQRKDGSIKEWMLPQRDRENLEYIRRVSTLYSSDGWSNSMEKVFYGDINHD